MPAAAVIPAPIAYIKVVAVKKLVVGFPGYLGVGCGHLNCGHAFTGGCATFLVRTACTLNKLECSRQAIFYCCE